MDSDSTLKCKRFNQVLSVILSTFIKAQKDDSLYNINFQLDTYIKKVNLKVPLALIIGDIQGGDQLVGRKGGYSSKKFCARMSPSCDVSSTTISKVKKRCCRRIKQDYVMHLVQTNNVIELSAISQRNVYLSWFDVDFGGSPYGVFTAACPSEALHAVESGLIEYCLEELFNEILTNKSKAALDKVVQNWFLHDKQRTMTAYMDVFPRLLFKDGVSDLTNVTANNKVGKMFAVVIAAQTKDGRNALKHASTMSYQQYLDMIHVFEMLLCYWSWLKKPYYWQCNDLKARKAAEKSIGSMLREIQNLWPRTAGCGWMILKFHNQLHVPFDIHEFGAHINFHSGPQENNHIENVKKRHKRTQKNKDTMDFQSGKRLSERIMVDHVYEKFGGYKHVLSSLNENSEMSDTSQAAKFVINIKKLSSPERKKKMKNEFQWLSNNKTIPHLDQNLVDWIVDTIKKKFPALKDLDNLNGYTEYRRQNVIFRAHPAYRTSASTKPAPWFDYIMVAWDDKCERLQNIDNATTSNHSSSEDECDGKTFCDIQSTSSTFVQLEIPVETEGNTYTDTVRYVPAKLCTFIQDPSSNTEKLFAIIHSCHFTRGRHSVLTNRWQLEYEGVPEYSHDEIYNINHNTYDLSSDDEIDDDYLDRKPPAKKTRLDEWENHLPKMYVDETNTNLHKKKYTMVEVENIAGQCLMVPFNNHSHFLLEVISREKWASRFQEDN